MGASHPFFVWNALDEIPVSGQNHATVAEALAEARRFVERFRAQGFYSSFAGRIPFDALTCGVLWDGMPAEQADALFFFVVDQRRVRHGGFVQPPQR
jgi:hypothetical protein